MEEHFINTTNTKEGMDVQKLKKIETDWDWQNSFQC